MTKLKSTTIPVVICTKMYLHTCLISCPSHRP